MEIKLSDLIDRKVLQEIQDGFANVTGMAALTTDADGVPVTEGSNFTDFCMKYTRQSPIGCKRCEECDRKGGDQTRLTGKAQAYVCHAGLMDFAAPIMLNGEFIGSFIGGQVLIDEPDENHFCEIAKEINVPEGEFISALRCVSVVPRQKVEAAADFLQTIAKVLSDMAYSNLMNQQVNHRLRESIDAQAVIVREVRQMSDSTARAVKDMDQRFASLAALADECKSEIENCGEVVGGIQDNATTTHILGLNASIEASRAKEEGFGVIASEVRNLADASKSSADVIKGKIDLIMEKAISMSQSTQEAKDIVDDCLQQLNNLKLRIAELQNNEFQIKF